jgi:hypothetical protein
MSNDIVEIPFHNDTLIAHRSEDGDVFVALRPICNSMGIDFSGQLQKMKRQPWATVGELHTVGADGKTRDMTSVNRKTLTMWLATIDASRLKDEQARRNVIVYQKEAAEALDQYFNEGGAIRVSGTDSDEDIMARAVLVAQKTIERKNQQLQAKDAQIKMLEPKAKALDDFTNIPDALLVRDAAKLLSNDSNIQIGEHELRQWLVDNGWIYRQPNQSWCAASSRVRQGHMVMVSSRSHGIHKDGTPFAYPPTPKLTRKGLALIHQRLSEQSFERVLDAEVAA